MKNILYAFLLLFVVACSDSDGGKDPDPDITIPEDATHKWDESNWNEFEWQ